MYPDRERYYPDTITVSSSGVRGINPGENWVVAPDHGAFVPMRERELRLFGISSPWWESFIAKVTDEGIAPGPGWALVEREGVKNHPLLSLYTGFSTIGTVVSDNTDQPTMAGQRIEFSHLLKVGKNRRFYTLKDGPKELCLIQDGFASRKWLRGLEWTAK